MKKWLLCLLNAFALLNFNIVGAQQSMTITTTPTTTPGCLDGSIKLNVTASCASNWNARVIHMPNGNWTGTVSKGYIWYSTVGNQQIGLPYGKYAIILQSGTTPCKDTFYTNIPANPCALALKDIQVTPSSLEGCTDAKIAGVVNGIACGGSWSLFLIKGKTVLGNWYSPNVNFLFQNIGGAFSDGDYKLIVKDKYGCSSDTAYVTVPAQKKCALEIKNLSIVNEGGPQGSNRVEFDISGIVACNTLRGDFYKDFVSFPNGPSYLNKSIQISPSNLGSEKYHYVSPFAWPFSEGNYFFVSRLTPSCSDTFNFNIPGIVIKQPLPKETYELGDSLIVAFSSKSTFQNDNIFTLELYDGKNSVLIDSIKSLNPYGTFRTKINKDIFPSSCGYHMRVKASNPKIESYPVPIEVKNILSQKPCSLEINNLSVLNEGGPTGKNLVDFDITGFTGCNTLWGDFYQDSITYPYGPTYKNRSIQISLTKLGSEKYHYQGYWGEGNYFFVSRLRPSCVDTINFFNPGIIINQTLLKDSYHSGDSLIVQFSAKSIFQNGNTFTLELSGGEKTITLGTLISINKNETFRVKIPSEINTICGYSLQVKASNPKISSYLEPINIINILDGEANRSAMLIGQSGPKIITDTIKLGNQYTISIWFKPYFNGDKGSNLLNFGDVLQLFRSAMIDKFYLFKIGNSTRLSFQPIMNEWNHLTVTVNNGTASIYLFGRLVATGPVPIYGPMTGYIWIGGAGWNGYVDDIAVFNYALSETEINKYYSSNLTGKESGCIRFWNFEDGCSDYATDVVTKNTKTKLMYGAKKISDFRPGFDNPQVIPSTAGNKRPVAVKIKGEFFVDGCTAVISKPGAVSIFSDTAIVAEGGRALQCQFNITNAKPGKYDVTVQYPDGSKKLYTNSFTIEKGTFPKLSVNVVGEYFNYYNHGDRILVQVSNKANTEAIDVPVYMMFDKPDSFSTGLKFINEYPKSTEVDWDTIPYYVFLDSLSYDTVQKVLVPIHIPVIRAGETQIIDLTIFYNSNSPKKYNFKTWVSAPLNASYDSLNTRSDCDQNLARIDCFNNLIGQYLGLIPGPLGCAGQIGSTILSHTIDAQCNGRVTKESWDYVHDAFAVALNCTPFAFAAQYEKIREGFKLMAEFAGAADNAIGAIANCKKAFVPAPGPGSGNETFVNRDMHRVYACDPNYKQGPKKFQNAGNQYQYTVHFENLASATAAARTVYIADTLEKGKFLNNTISFEAFGVGDSIYPLDKARSFSKIIPWKTSSGKPIYLRVEGNLDTVSNIIKVLYSSLDTTYLFPVTDLFAGFLPPNSITPLGEGFIMFSLKTRDDLVTNDKISNKAAIYFDNNPPIITDSYINVIDDIPPTSAINSPSISYDTTFTVTWNGQDVGSGIENYDVFVSDNGGEYWQWKWSVSAKSGLFNGKTGHTYRFFSMARDSAGNEQKDTLISTTEVKTATGFENLMNIRYGLRCFPNPTANTATIEFTLPLDMQSEVILTDAFGSLKKTISNGKLSQGKHQVEINLSDLSQGLYFYTLKTKETSVTQKLVKIN